MNCKLLIADDHVLFNDAIKAMLENEPGIEVAGQVFSGDKVMEFVKHSQPDMILLDINMPLVTGMDVVNILSQSHPFIRIIILSMYSDKRFVQECRKNNVAGYILKNASKDDLLKGIRTVMEEGIYYDPDLEKDSNIHQQDDFIKKFNLTKRELEIIRLVKENYTAQDIASKLFISVFTVETHRRNINLKLKLKNTLGLVKFAMEHNL